MQHCRTIDNSYRSQCQYTKVRESTEINHIIAYRLCYLITTYSLRFLQITVLIDKGPIIFLQIRYFYTRGPDKHALESWQLSQFSLPLDPK